MVWHFFQHSAFASDDGLRNEEIAGVDQAHVGRHTVACGKPHGITDDQLRCRHVCPVAIPAYHDRRVEQLREVVGNALGTHFLNEADDAADHQHGENQQYGGHVAAEIRWQKDVGDKGNSSQNKQNDRKRIDESAPQTVKDGVMAVFVDGVASVLCAAACDFLVAVAVSVNMKGLQQRLFFQMGVIAEALRMCARAVHNRTSEMFASL